MNIILKRPIVSEKSVGLTKAGWYTFLVNAKATKHVIAQAVEKQFGVKVVDIKTASIKAQNKLQRGNRRKYFSTGEAKKAMIRLKDGQKIGLFETEAKVEKVEEQEAEVKEKKSLLKGTRVKIEKEGKENDEKKKKGGKK